MKTGWQIVRVINFDTSDKVMKTGRVCRVRVSDLLGNITTLHYFIPFGSHPHAIIKDLSFFYSNKAWCKMLFKEVAGQLAVAAIDLIEDKEQKQIQYESLKARGGITKDSQLTEMQRKELA